ncbi:MAG: hypothetical protein Q8R44_18895 [Novosphingobium sp.]|nr:hypothetical protein [Novosphingobium sp.]
MLASWRYAAWGFNPTDDGFVLAYARRILEGQVPHRDFIAIHLAGSGYLHAPFVAFGGEHTYLISRVFVWVQLAFIACAWTELCARFAETRLPLAMKVAIALISLTLSAHYFPDMAWHTIDGLFLISAGLWLRVVNPGRVRFGGDILLGAAILCKQNFVFCVPLIILLCEQRQRGMAALCVIALPTIYVLGVIISGGATDAWAQLTTQSDLATPGFYKYLWEPAYAGGAVIGLLTIMLLRSRSEREQSEADQAATDLAGLAIVLVLIVGAANAMTQGRYLGSPAFGLFGLACGATLALAAQSSPQDARWRIGLIAVAVGWCTALSIGYNTPALAAGAAVTFLLQIWLPRARSPYKVRWVAAALVGMVGVWCLWAFDLARMKFVYLERPARELTWRLDGVLPGGAGLRTDRNTFFVLRELRALTSSADGRYAVLPDFAGWWPAAEQVNPLPVDWPQWIELGSPVLRTRAIAAMNAQRGKLIFVVAKYETPSLANGFTPASISFRYPLAAYVRTHYTRIGETAYFEIYR